MLNMKSLVVALALSLAAAGAAQACCACCPDMKDHACCAEAREDGGKAEEHEH